MAATAAAAATATFSSHPPLRGIFLRVREEEAEALKFHFAQGNGEGRDTPSQGEEEGIPSSLPPPPSPFPLNCRLHIFRKEDFFNGGSRLLRHRLPYGVPLPPRNAAGGGKRERERGFNNSFCQILFPNPPFPFQVPEIVLALQFPSKRKLETLLLCISGFIFAKVDPFHLGKTFLTPPPPGFCSCEMCPHVSGGIHGFLFLFLFCYTAKGAAAHLKRLDTPE